MKARSSLVPCRPLKNTLLRGATPPVGRAFLALPDDPGIARRPTWILLGLLALGMTILWLASVISAGPGNLHPVPPKFPVA